MGDFYSEIILNDPRASSVRRVDDLGLLEPATRIAVQNIISEAKQLGLELMVFETYRSKQRQEQLFKEGKSRLRDVGVHHYGLACDIVKSINGQPSWDGSFSLLGRLAFKYGLIWGGDWGDPTAKHDFIDADHVQRCSVGQQKALFLGQWYPGDNYNPYNKTPVGRANFLTGNVVSLPEPAPHLTVNLLSHVNYTDKRLEKLQIILQWVETVFNSDTFKNDVLKFTTNGVMTFYYRRNFLGRYIDQPYTNNQVYCMIMSSKEMVGDVKEGSMDLYLELLDGSDGDVIGYGNPESREIYTYSGKFDQLSVQDLANHYAHEWCHKLGFEHAFHHSPNRSHSVPCAIGNMVESITHSLTSVSDDQLK